MARKLSQFLGKLNAATRTVPVAPLFYRNLQTALGGALSTGTQDYSVSMEITPNMREELQWWEEHLSQWNGRTLVTEKPSVIIESDASNLGWGATSQGIWTGGPWSRMEPEMHINCLEALAAFLAVKCFVRDSSSMTVLDNISAVTYVNKLRGTVSQSDSHNQGTMVVVPTEGRNSDSRTPSRGAEHNCQRRVSSDEGQNRLETEPRGVHLDRQLGPLTVDLFASRLTNQLPRYFSWRPDPQAEAMSAFSQRWDKLGGKDMPTHHGIWWAKLYLRCKLREQP